MPWEQSFIVEGQFLGTALRTFGTTDAAKPESLAFCCPDCGRMWAVCPMEGRPFHFLRRGCPQHIHIHDDGSLYCSWDRDFFAAWPEAVLHRELVYLIEKETGPLR